MELSPDVEVVKLVCAALSRAHAYGIIIFITFGPRAPHAALNTADWHEVSAEVSWWTLGVAV